MLIFMVNIFLNLYIHLVIYIVNAINFFCKLVKYINSQSYIKYKGQ